MRRVVLLLAAAAMCVDGHVGSPDIFLEGSAGPYPMFVTIRPPTVIPGVAEIEVRTRSPYIGPDSASDIKELRITPMPMTGEASKHPPTPDVMKQSKEDPKFYTGSLWIMASGSWQVRIQASGSKGDGQLSVPVPAVASMTKPMQKAMGVGLFAMMLLLALGLVSIVGAGAREGQLDAGKVPDGRSKVRARVLMGVAAAFVAFVLWAGNNWWTSEAGGYSGYIYQPLEVSTEIQPGDKLKLTLKETAWKLRRDLDDFLPDHGHLMHLYVIGEPDAHHVWHLHPEFKGGGVFEQSLPAMPVGKYKLYGDVVHRSGFAETVVTELNVTRAMAGNPLTGDDAGGERGVPPDGARIDWAREATPIIAKKPQVFKFKLIGKDGNPVTDAQFYMGMLGHAAFVKNDGTVFAHVHPSGSVPMAALAVANPTAMDHSSHEESRHNRSSVLPAEADFPYGFPSPGDYRIIVQMKHAGIVETGVFDVKVE